MVFSDVSEKAYAACAYLFLLHSDGHIECNLVAAKARVAPLKKLTNPRLELMGAILAIRLTETLTMELHTPIHRIIMWSDSAIVLQWIGRSSSGYHAFAGNRINEIDDGLTRLREKLQTKEAFFRYVPTDLNPADDATKVLVTHQFKDGPVQSAELKTKLGTCTRPANKLCFLLECPPVSAP